VFCLNPEDTKIILNSPSCLKKPRIIYNSFFESGLVFINGEEYKAHRKAITPLFSPKSLKSFVPYIDEIANEFLESFDGKLTGDIRDISHDTMDFALHTTLRIFLNDSSVNLATRTDLLNQIET
jgi:cytochrome P450